ncbi:hypothetical protein BTO06_12255 [Tenacibaculum sp. SZ-18]|uniref:hypothetical protein n=1 Tax=Tenacibaculum sp. SZ-18 TaxID=754423 RepID=UPI000C2D1E0F|nr:hypothetical protein [Tenacibaculum sp. SZ-18]AUC15875.1 hypothetical protein BTO06_12255 [Tenacibaculum sp. SZ-18]
MFYLNSKGYKTRLVQGVDITLDEIPNDSVVRFQYPNEKGPFVLKRNNKFYDPNIGEVLKYKYDHVVTHWLQFHNQH